MMLDERILPDGSPTVDAKDGAKNGNAVNAQSERTSQYTIPFKAILTASQLDFFRSSSKTHEAVLRFMMELNESVVGVELSTECFVSEVRASCF